MFIFLCLIYIVDFYDVLRVCLALCVMFVGGCVVSFCVFVCIVSCSFCFVSFLFVNCVCYEFFSVVGYVLSNFCGVSLFGYWCVRVFELYNYWLRVFVVFCWGCFVLGEADRPSLF